MQAVNGLPTINRPYGTKRAERNRTEGGSNLSGREGSVVWDVVCGSSCRFFPYLGVRSTNTTVVSAKREFSLPTFSSDDRGTGVALIIKAVAHFTFLGSPSFRLILVVRNSRTHHVMGSSPRISYAPYRLHLK